MPEHEQTEAATEIPTETVEAKPEKTFTQAELDKAIAERLTRERSKYTDYDQLKADSAELQKVRDAAKSDLQKALERAEAAEKAAAEASFTALRTKIAAAKGVPAASLTGTTEDELSASADELIAWRDANKPTPAVPKKPALTALKSGATNTESLEHSPKAAAAEALRRLRSG